MRFRIKDSEKETDVLYLNVNAYRAKHEAKMKNDVAMAQLTQSLRQDAILKRDLYGSGLRWLKDWEGIQSV